MNFDKLREGMDWIIERYYELVNLENENKISNLRWFDPDYFTLHLNGNTEDYIEFMEFSYADSETKNIKCRYFEDKGLDRYYTEVIEPKIVARKNKNEEDRKKRYQNFLELKKEFEE